MMRYPAVPRWCMGSQLCNSGLPSSVPKKSWSWLVLCSAEFNAVSHLGHQNHRDVVHPDVPECALAPFVNWAGGMQNSQVSKWQPRATRMQKSVSMAPIGTWSQQVCSSETFLDHDIWSSGNSSWISCVCAQPWPWSKFDRSAISGSVEMKLKLLHAGAVSLIVPENQCKLPAVSRIGRIQSTSCLS